MVTTAMSGYVLQLSVVARRRVMPGPGVCYMPDPGGESPTRDRPACGCSLRIQGCGAGARSQSADANCGYEFTRSKQVLCQHRGADPQVNIRWLPEPGPRR